jgi:predicted dehydrogenase
MIFAAKKNKVRLMEALMFHFHPQHSKVKELVKANYLGKLFNFTGFYGFHQFQELTLDLIKD